MKPDPAAVRFDNRLAQEQAKTAREELELLRAEPTLDDEAATKLMSVQQAASFPLRPDLADITPTLVIRPGETRRRRGRVRRSDAGQLERLEKETR